MNETHLCAQTLVCVALNQFRVNILNPCQIIHWWNIAPIGKLLILRYLIHETRCPKAIIALWLYNLPKVEALHDSRYERLTYFKSGGYLTLTKKNRDKSWLTDYCAAFVVVLDCTTILFYHSKSRLFNMMLNFFDVIPVMSDFPTPIGICIRTHPTKLYNMRKHSFNVNFLVIGTSAYHLNSLTFKEMAVIYTLYNKIKDGISIILRAFPIVCMYFKQHGSTNIQQFIDNTKLFGIYFLIIFGNLNIYHYLYIKHKQRNEVPIINVRRTPKTCVI